VSTRVPDHGIAVSIHRLLGAPGDATSFAVVVTSQGELSLNKCVGSVSVLSTVGSGLRVSVADVRSDDLLAAEFLPTRIALQRGDHKLGTLVQAWLAASFDCSSAPLAFSPYLLLSVATTWLAEGPRRPLELSYAAPARAADKGLDALNLAVPFETVETLRAATRTTTADVQRNGEGLLAALESHVRGVTHMSLAAFRLERIACTVGTLGCDGRVKFSESFAAVALRALSQFVVHSVLLEQPHHQYQHQQQQKRRRVGDDDDEEKEANN
jgi:hypothetical protein